MFVWLTPAGRPESQPLSEALHDVIFHTDAVDKKLNEIAESLGLLTLQDQCKLS